MVSVFFNDTVRVKARQTSTMTFIILATPCDDRKTTQASVQGVCSTEYNTRKNMLDCCSDALQSGLV